MIDISSYLETRNRLWTVYFSRFFTKCRVEKDLPTLVIFKKGSIMYKVPFSEVQQDFFSKWGILPWVDPVVHEGSLFFLSGLLKPDILNPGADSYQNLILKEGTTNLVTAQDKAVRAALWAISSGFFYGGV